MSFNTSLNFSWFVQTSKPILVGSVPSSVPTPIVEFKVKVYPEWYRQVTVEWSVPAEWGDCVFNVHFSQTEDGPYEKLTHTPIAGPFFADTSTQEYGKFHNGHYVIEAILLDNGNVTRRSAPATWKNKQRRWVEIRSTEIQRREYWLLSKFGGIKSYLFKRKRYGKRCPSCFSKRTGQVLDDHCPVCLGTGFEGGYFEPMEMFMQYETTPNDRNKTYFGNFEPNQIGAWTISIPEINDEDVVVRTDNWSVYRVGRMTPTELQGNTVRQMCVLNQLSKGDIEYKLIDRNLPEFPTGYFI